MITEEVIKHFEIQSGWGFGIFVAFLEYMNFNMINALILMLTYNAEMPIFDFLLKR